MCDGNLTGEMTKILLLVQFLIVSDGKLKIMRDELKMTGDDAVFLVVAGGSVSPVKFPMAFSMSP